MPRMEIVRLPQGFHPPYPMEALRAGLESMGSVRTFMVVPLPWLQCHPSNGTSWRMPLARNHC